MELDTRLFTAAVARCPGLLSDIHAPSRDITLVGDETDRRPGGSECASPVQERQGKSELGRVSSAKWRKGAHRGKAALVILIAVAVRRRKYQ